MQPYIFTFVLTILSLCISCKPQEEVSAVPPGYPADFGVPKLTMYEVQQIGLKYGIPINDTIYTLYNGLTLFTEKQLDPYFTLLREGRNLTAELQVSRKILVESKTAEQYYQEFEAKCPKLFAKELENDPESKYHYTKIKAEVLNKQTALYYSVSDYSLTYIPRQFGGFKQKEGLICLNCD